MSWLPETNKDDMPLATSLMVAKHLWQKSIFVSGAKIVNIDDVEI